MKHIFSSLILVLIIAYSSYGQAEGRYTIQSAVAGKHLDVQWGNASAGTPLHLWPGNNGTAQRFRLINAGDNYFYIQSILGRYVYAGENGQQRSIVAIGDRQNKDTYKWRFENAGGGYHFIRSKSGQYMDVQWGSSEDGTPIWMWPGNRGAAQKWKLHSIDAPEDAVSIASGLWTSAFSVALQGVDIRINNFTPTDFEFTNDNTYRWQKENDSHFKMESAGMAPYERVFNLKPFRKEPMTIYIHDLNLSRSRVSHQNGKIKVSFIFETNGTEVRTNCIDNFICGGVGNPNFNIDNPVIDVLFEPIVSSGQLTYQNAEVDFRGQLNHEGFNMGVEILQAIANMLNFDVNGEVSRQANTHFSNYLNDAGIKRTITTFLNNNLDQASRYGINLPETITDVEIDRSGNLLIF